MARMAFSAAQTGFRAELATAGLALVSKETEAQPGWSIDDESMGCGWHDSSWMLKKGLDVIENPPPTTIPPEWSLRWWMASNAAHALR